MVSASKSFPQSSSTYDAATGITYVSQYDVFTIGAGYLDLQNALSEAFNPPPANSSMNSPLASYDTSSGNVYFGSDQHALWGSSSIWDTHALWGSNVFVGTQSTLWGSHALWGAASSDDTEALSLTANGEN